MPDKKLYHTIGQVSEFTDLPQSVLRYWETVFPRFTPQKSPGGNRLYTDDDVKLIQTIKNLLYEKKFTIQGANAQLEKLFVDNREISVESMKTEDNPQVSSKIPQGITSHLAQEIKQELEELIRFLEE